ncbi:MAG: glycosyltransferase family 2 protein [Lachnospiraceae bacterium]
MDKKISVIIPCYQVENCIQRCFASLVEQTIGLGSLEVVLVDNGSTDGTFAVLSQLEQQYPEDVILLQKKVNGRPGAARNDGVRHSTAPYVFFLDADDWLEPETLEQMHRKIVQTDADMVKCGYVRDFADGNCIPVTGEYLMEEKLWDLREEKMRRQCILVDPFTCYPWSKLFSRRFLTENDLFFAERIYHEDWIWGHLSYLYFQKVYNLPQSYYHYYETVGSFSLTCNEETCYERACCYEKLLDKLRKIPDYEKYSREYEYVYLKNDYISLLKLMAEHGSGIYKSVFERLQNFIRREYPDYASNPFVERAFPEPHKMLLQFIHMPIGEEDLRRLTEIVRQLKL